MHRLLHKLRTATGVGLSLAVSLVFLVFHPRRVVKNRKARRFNLAKLGIDTPVPRSILVVKMDGLGDFVLATPLFSGLRSRFPEARIVFVVDQWLRDAVQPLGLANEVLGFDWRGGVIAAARRAARFASERLSGPFDMAVVPRWEVDSNYASLLAFLSGSTLRIGFSRRVSRRKRLLNLFNDAFYSHSFVASAELHEVEKNLYLSRLLGVDSGANSLYFHGAALPKQVEVKLARRENAPLIALGIGAMGENRKWPIGFFGQIAVWVFANYNDARVVVIGGAADRESARSICSQVNENPRLLDLTGALSVGQSFEVIRRCTVYVGNDSGPKHLAAAAKRPIVEISSFPLSGDPTHYTAVNRYGAWGARVAILQPERPIPPCSKACEAYEPHCIATISPQRVIAALQEILQETSKTLTVKGNA